MVHLKNLFIFLSLIIKSLGENRKKIPEPSKMPRGGIDSPRNAQRSGIAEIITFFLIKTVATMRSSEEVRALYGPCGRTSGVKPGGSLAVARTEGAESHLHVL